MATREELIERILEYPLVEYGFLKSDQVEFTQRVREVCRIHCPQYGKSWACPPAVGTVEECRERCSRFEDVLIFSTMAEVNDITNMEETLATREGHEEVTRGIRDVVQELFGECQPLSTESCAVCEKCAYLSGKPCVHPERMIPCVESYGIVVTEMAEKSGMTFMQDYNTVIWFSAIFYSESGSSDGRK